MGKHPSSKSSFLGGKLHTDLLEERYGNISIRILRQNPYLRESLLVDPRGICRTYALTFFHRPTGKEISSVDQKIKAGVAIGKSFREEGYSIRKNIIVTCLIELPEWLKREFESRKPLASAKIYEFYVKKEKSKPIRYGLVAEIYSPDFIDSEVNRTNEIQIGALSHYLEKNGFSKEDIWNNLERNVYEGYKRRYSRSKKESSLQISCLLSRIKKEIQR